jgi:hypothetical protein
MGFLVAALLSAAPARAASVDQALAGLESRVALLEDLQSGGTACASVVTEPEVRADLSTGTALTEAARGVLLTATRAWYERLYNARAFEAGGPEVCDELAPLRATVAREKIAGDLAFDLLCKTNYYEALMAVATMRKQPRMFDLCLVRNRVGDRDFKLDSLDASCRIIAERKGTVDEVCGRLGPYYDNASIAQTCTRMLRYVSGDPTVCPLFGDELVHERCEGYVAYGKSVAKDDAACAASPQCLMMSGKPQVLADLARKRIVAEACAVYARPEIMAERARAARDEAQAAFARLSADAEGTLDRTEAGAADARLEKAARLASRAGALAEKR